MDPDPNPGHEYLLNCRNIFLFFSLKLDEPFRDQEILKISLYPLDPEPGSQNLSDPESGS